MKIAKITTGAIKRTLKCHALKAFALKKCFVAKKEHFLFKIHPTNKTENKPPKGIKNEEVMKSSHPNTLL